MVGEFCQLCLINTLIRKATLYVAFANRGLYKIEGKKDLESLSFCPNK